MKKPLKVAAWSGVIYIILQILSIILLITLFLTLSTGYNFTQILIVIIMLAGLVFTILFKYGFLILGKRYNNKLLKVLAWISIVAIILSILYLLITGIISLVSVKGVVDIQQDLVTGDSSINLLPIILILILLIFEFIFNILWGVSLIKLRNEFRIAKAAGILRIVSVCSFPIFILLAFIPILVGLIIIMLPLVLLLFLTTFILEIVLLFNASKKLESGPGTPQI
ncbi:hypothetical protein ACFLZJ_00150 [Nanoarchaeota archaeon]